MHRYRNIFSSSWWRWAVVAVLVIVACTAAWLIYRPQPDARGQAGVDCTSHADTAVVTFYYAPASSADSLRALIRSLGGTAIDAYPSLQGYSFSISTDKASAAVARLHTYPQVTSVRTSPAEGCLDPD